MNNTDLALSGVCETIMRQFARLVPSDQPVDLDLATRALRETVKRFVFDPAYSPHRECSLMRTLSGGTIISSLACDAIDRYFELVRNPNEGGSDGTGERVCG